MGTIFVTLDENKTILEPYDSDNNNVPDGAVQITEDEFKDLSNANYVFSDFEIIANKVKLKANALDNRKTRDIEKIQSNSQMKYIIDILLMELNEIRTSVNLPEKSMSQIMRGNK
jgi:hypothetical protein